MSTAEVATAREIGFGATTAQRVSGLLLSPPDAVWLLVLGHGAGAGMRHPFLEAAARGLAGRRIATFRYQFPYMERGRKAPDPRAVLLATVRSAVAAAREASGLPLLAGGKSMGGRMTSLAASEGTLKGVRGLVFFGFPLHPSGKPSDDRGEHLARVPLPMLFLQGTRDALAERDRMRSLCRTLGARATLHEIEGGDHGFHLPRASGQTDAAARDELLDAVLGWAATLPGRI